MISNTAAKYLWDVQRAIERIAQFTTGRTFDDYLTDEMLSAAIERQFEIIGEAFAGLRRRAPDIAAVIPDISQIIGFRNVLVHAYDTVDAGEVWSTIQNDLPRLRSAVADLLRDAPSA
jgi:uncharacterized protein with HEPN domain